MYTNYEECYARVSFFYRVTSIFIFGVIALYLSFGTLYEDEL